MQRSTANGLETASLNDDEMRCHITCIHGAEGIGLEDALLEQWAHRTVQQAHDLLQNPDVTVTNTSDKAIQLTKLLRLDQQVRELWKENSEVVRRGIVLSELHADSETVARQPLSASRKLRGGRSAAARRVTELELAVRQLREEKCARTRPGLHIPTRTYRPVHTGPHAPAPLAARVRPSRAA